MTQQQALDILKMGFSVYLTGEAGAGKTHTLNVFISWLREHDIEPVITASTGIAATHIEGSTIHSWAGVGIRERVTDFDLEQMEQKKPLWRRFEEAQIVILDEVSMISGDFLDMLDRVCRHMKRNEKPFGGLQMIFSGDFFQLPPIVQQEGQPRYAFQAQSWKNLNPVTCYLTSQHRHEGGEFYELLSAIRRGEITQEVYRKLEERKHAQTQKRRITRLYTHNVDVDALNNEQLNKLKGEEKVFTMQTAGKQQHVEQLIKGCLAPEELYLKENAEVMFVKNDPSAQYVNGTQGRVVGFEKEYPVIKTRSGEKIKAIPVAWRREDDGKVLAEITQVPLRLAWAITVHKSQGMTLDEAEIDLGRSFVAGQGYVALSRVRGLEGLYLQSFNQTALQIDQSVALQDRVFREHSRRAEERLSQIEPHVMQEKQKEYILQCGGSVVPVSREKKLEKKKKTTTVEKTRILLDQGKTLEQAAKERGLSLNTVIGHVEMLLQRGGAVDVSYLAPPKKIYKAVEIAVASTEEGFEFLNPIKRDVEKQGYTLSYDELRLIRLYFLSQQS